jgi:hypothetical protein
MDGGGELRVVQRLVDVACIDGAREHGRTVARLVREREGRRELLGVPGLRPKSRECISAAHVRDESIARDLGCRPGWGERRLFGDRPTTTLPLVTGAPGAQSQSARVGGSIARAAVRERLAGARLAGSRASTGRARPPGCLGRIPLATPTTKPPAAQIRRLVSRDRNVAKGVVPEAGELTIAFVAKRSSGRGRLPHQRSRQAPSSRQCRGAAG